MLCVKVPNFLVAVFPTINFGGCLQINENSISFITGIQRTAIFFLIYFISPPKILAENYFITISHIYIYAVVALGIASYCIKESYTDKYCAHSLLGGCVIHTFCFHTSSN